MQAVAQVTDAHRRRALRIHRDLPVVDGHNDLPWEIRTRAAGSLEAADPTGRLDAYHTDFPRLLRGGVGVQFWSVFVPAWSASPLGDTLGQIDLVEEMSRRGAAFTALAADAADAERIRDGGRIAGFLGAEGGHAIEDSLEGLRTLAGRGVRYMTLTHADTLEWADSATDEPRHGGLSPFGEAVVAEMNRLGMLVDVSHVSAEVMRHAIRVSRTPVIASHSSAFALAPHPRNVPDDVLAMVGETGGVVMVAFVPAFIVAATARRSIEMFEEERRLRASFAADDEAGYQAARRERVMALDIDRGSVADVVDHIEHVARVAGVDHVGLGSDFDGVELLPDGLEDASCFPAITAELLAREWPESDVRKVLGENTMRVLRAAEEAAAR
jgi:membrane dipeptidase